MNENEYEIISTNEDGKGMIDVFMLDTTSKVEKEYVLRLKGEVDDFANGERVIVLVRRKT